MQRPSFVLVLLFGCLHPGACLGSEAEPSLLSDPALATVGSDESPWIPQGVAARAEPDGWATIVGGEAAGMLWQELPAPAHAERDLVTAEATCVSRGGRAWLSVHFYDAAGERIGQAASEPCSARGTERRLRLRTQVPVGSRRAVLCLVVSAGGSAAFSGPSVTIVTAAPTRAPSSVACAVADQPWPPDIRGIGKSVALGEAPDADAGTWAGLRIEVSWRDMGEPGAGPGAASLRQIERWLAATQTSRCPVTLSLVDGERLHFADEQRCAEWAAGLLSACLGLPGAERLRWVSLCGDTGSPLAPDDDAWMGCATALAPLLPRGCRPAGPEGNAAGPGFELQARAIEGLGGRVLQHLVLPARDLSLAEERIAAYQAAGRTLDGRVSVVEDAPSGAAHLGSPEAVLDTVHLVARVLSAGWGVAYPPRDRVFPAGLLEAVASAAGAGRVVRAVRSTAPDSVAAVWFEGPDGSRRAVLLVNRADVSLPVTLTTPERTREVRFARRAWLAGEGFVEASDRCRMRDGLLADVVGGRSVVVLTEQ